MFPVPPLLNFCPLLPRFYVKIPPVAKPTKIPAKSHASQAMEEPRIDLAPIDGKFNRVHLALNAVSDISDDGRPDFSQLLVKAHKRLVIAVQRILGRI
jgi:hypothetical protein